MFYVLLIIAVLIALSIGTIFFFSYLAKKYYQALSKRRFKAIDQSLEYRKQTKPKPYGKKTDDLRSKDRGREKQIQETKEVSMDTGVEVYQPEGRDLARGDDKQIVGIAQPVGRFSKFIMQQKLGFILAMGGLQSLSGGKKNGFWVNLIKAQAASRGKGQGQGRG